MPSSVSELDPYLNSVQWSRRFLGLRLFLSLARAGWPGLGAHVERSVAVIARTSRERLLALRLADRQRFCAGGARCAAAARARRRPRSGRRVVASGAHGSRPRRSKATTWCRICATNGETCETDVEALVAGLNEPPHGEYLRRSQRLRYAAPREWKFSGVMSACGMAMSNSISTASIRLTILSEVTPRSLSWVRAGTVREAVRNR